MWSEVVAFRGINAVNIDEKGRFAMPKKYRAELGSQANGRVIVTIDTDERCLLLYPLDVWEEIEEKLQSLPTFSAATRRIQRLLIGHATEVDMDSQGRLLLPSILREHAEFQKKVMVIGQGKKFEIWAEAGWEEQRKSWLATGVSTSGEEIPNVLEDISV